MLARFINYIVSIVKNYLHLIVMSVCVLVSVNSIICIRVSYRFMHELENLHEIWDASFDEYIYI